MGRNVVLVSALGLIALLAFLTLSELVQNGLDPLVIVSLVIVALLGFGVVGALTTPPDD
jgi:hypothetical protein